MADESDDLTRELTASREELHVREERLSSILNAAVDAIVTIDRRGIITGVNPATERLFGYTPDEMIGSNVGILMPAPYSDEHDGYIERYLETREPRIIGIGREVTALRKDGTTFPAHLAVSEIDHMQMFTGIVRDISELKQAEKQATRLGRILEESRNEIYLFDVESLRFEFANRGARKNLGYTMKELRELTPIDLKPEFTRESFESLIEPLRNGDVGRLTFETTHRRKDASTYPVDVHLQCAGDGLSRIFVAIILDATERRRAEETIRHLATIVESSDDAIVGISLDGTIQSWNKGAERIYGYRSEETIGRSIDILSTPEQAQEVFDALDRLKRGERVTHYETTRTTKDGRRIHVSLNISAVEDDAGNVVSAAKISRDITDLTHARQRMLQSERLAAIGQMMTGLAHESRNALQRTRACLDMLELELGTDPENVDLIHRGQAALDELHRLYEEVRGYAAPIQLEVRECDLSQIWRTAWQHLDIHKRELQVDLEEHTASVDLHCRLDPHRIGQVMRIILENAKAAIPDSGVVRIECADTDIEGRPGVRILFRDNGPGFPDDRINRIFEPFFTTKSKGTGLGMAIAKRIVEAHGGLIGVANVQSGGAQVELTLPRSAQVDPSDAIS